MWCEADIDILVPEPSCAARIFALALVCEKMARAFLQVLDAGATLQLKIGAMALTLLRGLRVAAMIVLFPMFLIKGFGAPGAQGM